MVRVVATAAVGLILAAGTSANAQAPSVRTVRGRLLTSVTKTPVAGGAVFVEEASIFATTDTAGGFLLQNVPVIAVAIRSRAIGYLPTRVVVPAGTDTLDVTTYVVETPHSRPDPARFPLSDSDKRAIWTALLLGLGSRRDTHFAELARAVPNAPIQTPTGPSTVVLMSQSGLQADSAWLRSLRASGAIADVCVRARAANCPQTGFRYFANLGEPQAFALDSVVVRVDYTSGDISLCRRGRAVYDQGNDTFLVARDRGTWLFIGRDQSAWSMAGGVYC